MRPPATLPQWRTMFLNGGDGRSRTYAQMSRTTATNLRICIAQLLATEGLSIGFFRRAPSLMALTAPIAIFLAPVDAVLDRDYLALLVWLPINATFLAVVALSIVRNRKIVASVVLMLFNFAGVVLTLGAY
jgi:hypothetical protein